MTPQIVAVDHCAGSGWAVACHRLGILEYGVEIMREAIRTRSANGFRTIYRDVWSGLFHPWLVPSHRLYISSPPCQTFSPSGKGDGRAALADILQAVEDRRFEDPARLFSLTESLDPRTALVLTPLAHIWAHRPELVALEQVPQVLPVWAAIAAVLRSIGYSVWTGVLSAEMYGVPQTRQRAILMARLDGVAEAPAATHSRYYPGEPQRLDRGVLPWVSMAEALGWDPDDIVGFPRLADTDDTITIDGTEYRARDLRAASEPALTVTEKARSWIRLGGRDPQEVAEWGRIDIPAPTVAGDRRLPRRAYRKGNDRQMDGALRLSIGEAAALQSFPEEHVFRGSKSNQFLQNGNAVPPLLAGAILGALLEEARERTEWESIFAEVAG